MIAAKLRHPIKRTELLVILAVAGTATAGAIVSRRFRSVAKGASQAPHTSEAAATSLIGHEFSFSGHNFHLLESARDTEDGTLRFDYSAPPGANISEHTHQEQQESFEVLSGSMGLRVGGQELILEPEQSAIGPPRVPHAWWNPSEEERVRFVSGIRPGLEVETMLETVF